MLKNLLTTYDCKSAGLIGRTFFTTDNISVGTPSGGGTPSGKQPYAPSAENEI